MNDRLMRGAPLGAVGVPSANGWMDTATFVKYLHHFIKHVKPSPSSPCMLILDGHGSHKSLEAVTLAKENGITLITIPPHTSHKLQPLDVSFYSPLKTRYNREVDKWMTANPGKRVTDYDIAELFAHAYEATASIDKAKSGFEKTGIFPYNPDVFSDEDYLSSAVTERRELGEPATDTENSSEIEVIVESITGMSSVPSSSAQPTDVAPSDSEGRSSADAFVITQQPSATPIAVSSQKISHQLPNKPEKHPSKLKSDQQRHKVHTTETAADSVAYGQKKKTGICLRRGVKPPQAGAHKVTSFTQMQRPQRSTVQKRWSTSSVKNKSYASRPPTAMHLRPPLPRAPKWLNGQPGLHTAASSPSSTLKLDKPENNPLNPHATGKQFFLCAYETC